MSKPGASIDTYCNDSTCISIGNMATYEVITLDLISLLIVVDGVVHEALYRLARTGREVSHL